MNETDLLEYESRELSEADLELKIMKSPSMIEAGLRFVASQRKTGRGPLDLLLLDSGNLLVIVELKVQISDDMLFQGLDYYDYVYSNLERLARAYEVKGLRIDSSKEPRLMLIAPDFSESLLNRCKWLDLAIDLYRYNALTVKKEGKVIGELIDFIRVQVPSKPEREEVITEASHLNYITASELRKVAEDFLAQVKHWTGVRLDPVKSGVSMKVGKDVFAYFYAKRDGFNVAGFLTGRVWQLLSTVKSPDDLTEAISSVKSAYENIKGQ